MCGLSDPRRSTPLRRKVVPMALSRRYAACLFVPAAAVLIALMGNAGATPAEEMTAPPEISAPAPDALTRIPPEVRLRKLHLVRPDLIPYPIAYEVYC